MLLDFEVLLLDFEVDDESEVLVREDEVSSKEEAVSEVMVADVVNVASLPWMLESDANIEDGDPVIKELSSSSRLSETPSW